jgi:hypothetical protein
MTFIWLSQSSFHVLTSKWVFNNMVCSRPFKLDWHDCNKDRFQRRNQSFGTDEPELPFPGWKAKLETLQKLHSNQLPLGMRFVWCKEKAEGKVERDLHSLVFPIYEQVMKNYLQSHPLNCHVSLKVAFSDCALEATWCTHFGTYRPKGLIVKDLKGSM